MLLHRRRSVAPLLRRALVKQALAPVALVDAGHASPELAPFESLGRYWIDWAQWLDDDTALAGTSYLGIWKLDCRSMTTRPLLQTTRNGD